MGTEVSLFNQFVNENNISDGEIIKKSDLEIYFINKSISYTTMRSYIYILKLLKILVPTSDKNNFIVNKKILDARWD